MKLQPLFRCSTRRREETKRGLVVAGVLGSQGGSVVGLPPGDEKTTKTGRHMWHDVSVSHSHTFIPHRSPWARLTPQTNPSTSHALLAGQHFFGRFLEVLKGYIVVYDIPIFSSKATCERDLASGGLVHFRMGQVHQMRNTRNYIQGNTCKMEGQWFTN